MHDLSSCCLFDALFYFFAGTYNVDSFTDASHWFFKTNGELEGNSLGTEVISTAEMPDTI